MVKIIMSEWHQVEKQYDIIVDEDLVQEVYPDYDEEQVKQVLLDLESGELDPETFIEEAYAQDVSIDFESNGYEDWWTERKGGFEVTYSIEDN